MSFSLEVFDVHNSGLAWNFRVSPDSCDNPGYYSDVDKLRREWIGIKHIVVCADPYAVGFYEKMGFSPIGNSYEVLYDGWNDNCVPMYMRLPEVT